MSERRIWEDDRARDGETTVAEPEDESEADEARRKKRKRKRK